jgi:hypothetical protein
MKPKINITNSCFRIVAIQVAITICIVAVLESCTCERGTWYRNKATGKETFYKSGEVAEVDTTYWNYRYAGEKCELLGITRGFAVFGSSGSSSPVIIEGIKPAEYFATTITVGSLLNFKSSNEDYGGGYGNHEPGVGLNIGVGTVLPFNKHWAVAPAIRFTQKNASEKLEYSATGGGGTETYIDKYSYNYLGGTMLAQYRAGKHVSLVAGPELNFLLASSVKNGGSSGTGEKQNLNKTSQKVGLDLLAGIKFEIPAINKRSRWGVQLMYDHRLSRLNKKKDENGQDVPAYKMKSVQLGLAYNICGCNKKK